MGTWRDDASPQAQQDLDGLLDVALGFAQQQLATRGEFFPYAAAVTDDGEAEMIAARPDAATEQPSAADVVESCVAALVSQRDHIRAGAVVTDVHVRELSGDSIRVDLEHVEGATLTVLLPYVTKRLGKGLDYGTLQAQPGPRRIWRD